MQHLTTRKKGRKKKGMQKITKNIHTKLTKQSKANQQEKEWKIQWKTELRNFT